jgi:hypothetical protein
MNEDKDTIWVITSEPLETTRGGFREDESKQAKPLKVKELAININLFLEQMSSVLEKTPEKIGKFHFEEFEIHAEVTAEGTIALLGSGGKIGAAGGLRFVFRRSTTSVDGK